jgi:flagellar biosynthesis protein FlhB
MADAPHPPTERKLRRARDRGEVARSPLLSSALVTAGVLAAIALGAESFVSGWRDLSVRLWSSASFPAPREALALSFETGARALAWPLAAALICAVLAGILQAGGLFSMRALAPDLARLDPIAGLSRTFSPSEIAARLGSIALALGILAIGLDVIAGASRGLIGRVDLAPGAQLRSAAIVLGAIAERTVALSIAAGVVAFFYRRAMYMRAQRMTHAELDRERRDLEGEPQARRARASIHRELALGDSAEGALASAAIAVYGAGVLTIVRRGLHEAGGEVETTVSLVARGPLAVHALSLARRACVPIANDPGLALGLARMKGPLERPLLERLARHLARSAK